MKLAQLSNKDKCDTPPLDDIANHAYQATELLKALANESRLMILCTLVDGEKAVGQLSELTDRAQSSVSQDLARLRRQDLVTSRRDGKTVYYSIKSEVARRVIIVLHEFFCTR